MGKLTSAAVRALRNKTAELQERGKCGQRPKGVGGPICTKSIKRGWDTCGRPACAAWKMAGDWDD